MEEILMFLAFWTFFDILDKDLGMSDITMAESLYLSYIQTLPVSCGIPLPMWDDTNAIEKRKTWTLTYAKPQWRKI